MGTGTNEVDRVDPKLYHLATRKHKKEFEQQAKRIIELEAENKKLKGSEEYEP